jgi:hypothetical protein
MRDSVVSEYAIADLRGKTDAQVIERQLCISASPFHVQLLEPAQQAGNLPEELQWPPRFCDNRPEHLDALQRKHAALFGEYPLGRDISAEARDLLRALKWLKQRFKLSAVLEVGRATLDAPAPRRFPGTRRAWVWRHLAVCLRPCIRAWC